MSYETICYEALCIGCPKETYCHEECTHCDAFERLVDAFVKPQAEWEEIVKETEFGSRWICSDCKKFQSYGRLKYCPNCGAKMKVNE